MSDITKCAGDDCPIRGMCRRFSDPNGSHQMFFTESPRKDGACDFFLPIELKAKIVRTELPSSKLSNGK